VHQLSCGCFCAVYVTSSDDTCKIWITPCPRPFTASIFCWSPTFRHPVRSHEDVEAAHKTETFGERAKSVRRRRIGVDLVWILFASFRILTTTSAFLFYPVLVSCDPRLCLHTVTRGVCVLPAALLPMACGSPSKSKSIEMKCGEPALQVGAWVSAFLDCGESDSDFSACTRALACLLVSCSLVDASFIRGLNGNGRPPLRSIYFS